MQFFRGSVRRTKETREQVQTFKAVTVKRQLQHTLKVLCTKEVRLLSFYFILEVRLDHPNFLLGSPKQQHELSYK